MFLQRKDMAPGRDPRRRPPAARLPARGSPECPASQRASEHKFPRQESGFTGIPAPGGRGRASPPTPGTGLALHLSGAPLPPGMGDL